MVVSQRNLQLVLVSLILSPGLFSHFLFKGELLVISLQLLQCLLTLLGVLVLQQPAHARDCLSLLGVSILFAFVSERSLLLVSYLLVSPVPLVLSVNHHALVVH